LCYPPTVKEVYLNQVGTTEVAMPGPETKKSTTKSSTEAPISQQFELASLLSSEQSLLITLLLFLGLGIGLAFTPCVFPMYPILSGIVIGQGKTISTSRAFTLSFVYVQGMAITYSLLGLIVASAGVQFQAGLQHPVILIALIVIFVLLAVVMFGAYELQLPSSWQEKLNAMSNKQTSGSYLGVLAMGAISGLVASPCTTAPLTGILLFIAQSGDLVLGFSALYVLSLGMGIPLILFGITGGKLLPKAGNWMNVVKVTFGFMMLAVAIMFVERLVTHMATDIAWTLLGLTTFTYFYVMNQNSQTTFYKGLRALLIFIGLFVSAGYGYQTINGIGHSNTQGQSINNISDHPEFINVSSIEDFNQALAEANAQGQTVMLDLYADWCVACKEFEKYTFSDSRVVTALRGSVSMRIDLTQDSHSNIAFQEHFSVLGLPTILFFDAQGQEIDTARVTGFMRAEPFAQHVNNLFSK
jgi:thiol:disulfide interchange protein DsbD